MRNPRPVGGEKKRADEEPFSTAAAAAAGRRSLLAWYDETRRDLPWRESSDPYRVLLSEVMLQQTRVEVVAPRYREFLERFATIETLANAGEEEVVAAWSGLGYYRRARNLHRAARAIVRRGGWPTTAAELARLPGLGRYTSAAVASIAFGEVVAVVDGNVERVAARLLALAEDPRRRAGRDRIEGLAGRLVDPCRPGDSNQALMELGATICRPRSPRCSHCPLAAGCAGRASGEPTAFPPRRRRAARRRERQRVLVVEEAAKVLLVRRSVDEGQLAGMWELPWVDARETDPAGALARRYGGRWQVGPPLARVEHSITVRDLELVVCRGGLLPEEGVRNGPEAGFFDAQQRREIATSSMVDKALAALEQATGEAQGKLPLG